MPPFARYATRLGAVAAGACLVAWGTITLARLSLGLAPVWPLNGLTVLVAVMSSPRWRAPTILAALAGAAVANLLVGDPPLLIVGFAVGNALLVTLATVALAELRAPGLGRMRLDRVAPRLALALLGGPALNATLQAFNLWILRGSPPMLTWEVSFGANMLGLVLTTPFLLLGRRALALAREAMPHRIRVAGSLGVTLVVSLFAFGPGGWPLGFTLLPAQALAAMTGGLPAALASQIIVTVVAVTTTSLGQGFIATLIDGSIGRVQYLQLLLACNGVAVLALGLLAERHARVVERLRRAHRRALADAAADRAFHRIVDQRIRAPMREVGRGMASAVLVEQLTEALSTAERMRAFTSLRHGASMPGLAPVALGPLIESVCAELSTAAQDRRVSFRTEDAGAAPLASSGALRDILLALARNGISYRVRDGGEVRFLVTEAEGSVRIAVEDDGAGIDPALEHRLFRPFDRLGLEQHPVPGLGLGLCYARRLASAMGGSLAHEPQPGCTRFVLTLPAAEVAALQPA